MLFRLNLERGRSSRSVTPSFRLRASLLASKSPFPPPGGGGGPRDEPSSLPVEGATGGETGRGGRGVVGAFVLGFAGVLLEEPDVALVEEVGAVESSGGR